MNVRKTVTADNKGIADITLFVRDNLSGFGIKGKELEKSCLAAEELAGAVAEHSEEGNVTVSIKGLAGYVTVEISSKGQKFALAESEAGKNLMDDEVGSGAQNMIRSILIRSIAERIRFRHILGINRVSFMVKRSKRAFLYQTLGAMALAIVAGMILSGTATDGFNTSLDDLFLSPVRTIYMNGLKMVVAPVVFFSIVSCIVRFTDISELGRMGGRILAMYLITTVIATGVGIGVFGLFQPGSALSTDISADSVEKITSQTVNVSIKDMIVNIVPSDFVQPFVESNMLQLIFLAITCGIAAGMIGRYSDTVRDLFEALNELFLKITTLIIRFMPLAVFCSICSLILKTGIKTILSVIGIFATFVFGLVCMMIVYCILMCAVARISPIPFLKKYPQTMLQVFSMASSNASIPLNMDACRDLGIAQKIYSLSIPLGATVNMDGTCVYMAVFALALARVYGVTVPAATLTSMVISIIVLSIGAPGIPGSGLICLSVLLTQIGVPTEAIGLVMGIDSLVGMFRCMSNCTGDVAVSVAVAKCEDLLDMDVYKGLNVSSSKG